MIRSADKFLHRIRMAQALHEQGVLACFLTQYLMRWHRARRWNRLGPDEYIDHKIEPGVRMRLPRAVALAGLIFLCPYDVASAALEPDVRQSWTYDNFITPKNVDATMIRMREG